MIWVLYFVVGAIFGCLSALGTYGMPLALRIILVVECVFAWPLLGIHLILWERKRRP